MVGGAQRALGNRTSFASKNSARVAAHAHGGSRVNQGVRAIARRDGDGRESRERRAAREGCTAFAL
jgi:hypothetical protein